MTNEEIAAKQAQKQKNRKRLNLKIPCLSRGFFSLLKKSLREIFDRFNLRALKNAERCFCRQSAHGFDSLFYHQ